MRRPNRVAQVYGFSVCFVTLITALAVLPSVVDAGFKLADPIAWPDSRRSSFWRSDVYVMNGLPSTFELYRLRERQTYEQRVAFERGGRRYVAGDIAVQPEVVLRQRSDAELRQEYELQKSELAALRRFSAVRFLATFGSLMIASVALFVTHWRWVRNLLALDLQAERGSSLT